MSADLCTFIALSQLGPGSGDQRPRLPERRPTSKLRQWVRRRRQRDTANTNKSLWKGRTTYGSSTSNGTVIAESDDTIVVDRNPPASPSKHPVR